MAVIRTDAASRSDWELDGSGQRTDKQHRMLCAVCGCLAQINWHGDRMDKDDWRHWLSAIASGTRMVRGYDDGTHKPGFVVLSKSSKSLSKSQAAMAITCGLHIGDHPEEQQLNCDPVQWSDAVLYGLGFSPSDIQQMRKAA